MARLVDRIRDSRFVPPAFAWSREDAQHNADMVGQAERLQAFLRQRIENIPLIVADNVAEYFYAGTDQEVWDLKSDFPNLAPPFPEFFVEWRLPAQMVSRETGVTPLSGRSAVGWHCETKTAVELGEIHPSARWLKTGAFDETQRPVGWGGCFTLLREDKPKEIAAPLGIVEFFIDDQGQMIGQHVTRLLGLSGSGISESDPRAQMLADYAFTHIFPLALTLSFLHCKNVVLRTEEPPEKLSRAHKKRHGKPMLRYHTLEIEPMKEVLRREGGSESTGLKKALHICRGHFADYTQGKGLFGKYHGRFWMPAHVRGSMKQGIVAKDYAVKQPRKSAKVLTVDQEG